MQLTLHIISPTAANVTPNRQTFDERGGSIGRDLDNSWVLPHSKVSGHHAVITYRHPNFYIEDTSRNGVFVNGSRNRLARGEPYALNADDRLLIEPYEILVSIAHDVAGRRPDARVASSFDDDDPFAAPPPVAAQPLPRSADEMSRQELDPLELLNLAPKPQRPANVPSARDLDRGSPLDQHFQPPAAVPDPLVERHDPLGIPEGYDPLAPDEPPARPRPAPPPPSRHDDVEPRDRDHGAAQPPPAPILRPAPAARRDVVPVTPPAHAAPSSDAVPSADLGAVLEGAGLDPADVTPELARTFGQILRVVVAGVMDVMRSRQQIKDEFRMRMTRFRPAENNPLKFSANVDDALHNLLVKRNPAYLPAVEAFEDAFTDLRNHQLAMLAGLRSAFEAMLGEFDPDRLQQEFDRHLNKGLVPAKLRYWEMYREKRQEIDKDPEATFRRLFAEEFARAYEEQLNQLKARPPE